LFNLAITEVYKNEGNKEYGKKEFSNAIYFYTEGIKVNCKDVKLNSQLYNNRATAHFYQGKKCFSLQHTDCVVLYHNSLYSLSLIITHFSKPPVYENSPEQKKKKERKKKKKKKQLRLNAVVTGKCICGCETSFRILQALSLSKPGGGGEREIQGKKKGRQKKEFFLKKRNTKT